MEIKDKYEREMYDFLTQRENFENMVKVMGMKDMVRDNLIIEFWDLVMKKLEVELKTMEGDWQIRGPEKREDYFNNGVPIRVWKKNWKGDKEGPPIELWWSWLSSRIHYGIGIMQQSNEFNLAGMRIRFKELYPQEKNFNTWWLLYRYHGFDFNNFEDLKHILPENRESQADEFAKLITDIAALYKNDLDNIANMKLNQ